MKIKSLNIEEQTYKCKPANMPKCDRKKAKNQRIVSNYEPIRNQRGTEEEA